MGPPIVGGAIPELVDLGSIRKQDEQDMVRKSGSSTPPWSLHQFLPSGSCPTQIPVLTSFDDEQQGLVMVSLHGN